VPPVLTGSLVLLAIVAFVGAVIRSGPHVGKAGS
jgi:hypothetical protein